MEIVVRTPHGAADVSIVSSTPTTTLGEVVAAVTGQAVPRVVLVDDRHVDASTPLDAAGLLLGSVVTSEPTIPPPTSDADVELLQVAGHGAGRIVRLGPGRYRVGPGRRSNADELDAAPVERTMFEFVVEPTGTSSEVSLSDGGSDVAIDGVPVLTAQPWNGATVTAGPRAFRVQHPSGAGAARSRLVADRDGTVSFSRPPRQRHAVDRRPVVDAVHDATHAAPSLWERRPDDPDAFRVPIGVRTDGTVVTADLATERATAIAGSERFRDALVRSIVVELVTLHGPADLDLVVLTAADDLGRWDWAKWLPHLRADGTPAIWCSPHDVSRWVGRMQPSAGPATTASSPDHLTVVILDAPALWNRRDAPMRSILVDPPAHMRLVALCDEAVQAPSISTTVISEGDGGLARVHQLAVEVDDTEVRPALAETKVAADVARALAPLVDVDLPPPASTTADDVGRLELPALIGADVDEILARWATTGRGSTIAIGRRDDEIVELPDDDRVTVVIGSSMGDAFDVAATTLLAQCVDRPPDALWIVPLAFDRSARSEALWQLPHAADRHDVDVAIEPRRLLARARAVLADPEGPARIVIVVEVPSGSASAPDDDWIAALADGVHAVRGLAMVVITDHTDAAGAVGDSIVRVERLNDTARIGGLRVATIVTREATTGEAFTPLQPTAAEVTALEVRPFVIGRALTTLERRVEQQWAQSANRPDPAVSAVITMLGDAASRWRHDRAPLTQARTAVPPPLPTRVELDDLFETSPGDGVPLGLVDDPGGAGARTMWWEPAGGSLFAFGSRRSGMEQVAATALLGLIDRFSELDVHLVVIEASSARRRALGGLDRPVRIVAPDRADEVVQAIDEIAAELDRLDDTDRSDRQGPRMVVVVADLVSLRRRYAEQPLGARIDEVLTRAGAVDSGVDVIAAATELDGAGPFARAATRRLVGASSDHRELAALGVDDPGELDRAVGRCRCFPGGELAQLATSDTSTEVLLVRRSAGGRS